MTTPLHVTPYTEYSIECWRGGVLIWTEVFQNLVTTAGKNKLLDACFKTGQAAYGWYIGLVSATGFVGYNATDTMASHTGWTESIAYSNETRPGYTVGTISAGSVSNSQARASFTIDATADIKGAFLTNSNLKALALDTLYGVGSFRSVRNIVIGDVLSVTVTVTIT